MSQRNSRRRQNARKRAEQEAREQAERKRQRRDVIGTVLFELLWFGSDAYWFWPQSPIATLWIGSIGVAIAIYRHVDSLDFVVRAIAATAATALIVQPYLPKVLPAETETHGWLIPANDDIGSDYPCSWAPKGSLVLLMGRHGMGGITTGHDMCVATMAGCGEFIHVKRGPAGILLTTTVRAPDSRIVARIKNNEFHLVQNEMSYAERSDDRSTLTVNDPDGNEAFYARYVNPHIMEIRGVFGCPGKPVLKVEDRQVITSNGAVISDSCSQPPPYVGCIFVFD
ncbi:MAG TPA: hypothetical protein VMD75_13390 [Candidatus Binataceae bacterium]|nr:hypothetical protein [Candidatus Binataceae bacterium]